MSADQYSKFVGGLWGLVIGAALTMIIGFHWGGWSTSSASQKLTEDAVLSSRASICVAQFMGTPDQKAKIKEFQKTESYQKSEFIEKGGWDRMPGQEKASWGVAGACVTGLEGLIKTGT
jgi:hypothetical protein